MERERSELSNGIDELRQQPPVHAPGEPERPRLRPALFYSAVGIVASALLVVGALIATDPSDNVRVGSVRVVPAPGGGQVVTGTVVNRTGNREYDRVTLVVDHVDAEGATVGSSKATAADVSPGETVRFTAPVPAAPGLRYRVSSMTCESGGSTNPRLCRLGKPIDVE